MGLVAGVCVMVPVMLLWNYLITPLYMGVPREVVEGMLLPIMLPFNVIKCGLNSALTMLIYKPCITALRKIGLIKSHGNEEKTKVKINPVAIILSIGVMAVMIVLFVTLKNS